MGRGLVGKGDLIDMFCVPTQTSHNGVVIDQVITYLKGMGASLWSSAEQRFWSGTSGRLLNVADSPELEG